MELNKEIESKLKNFHELELDDRILKVKLILMKPICCVCSSDSLLCNSIKRRIPFHIWCIRCIIYPCSPNVKQG